MITASYEQYIYNISSKIRINIAIQIGTNNIVRILL